MMGARSRHAFELAGWLIFVASACFFLAATIKSGDALSIAGSGLFLAACFIFMVPLVVARPVREQSCKGNGAN